MRKMSNKVFPMMTRKDLPKTITGLVHLKAKQIGAVSFTIYAPTNEETFVVVRLDLKTVKGPTLFCIFIFLDVTTKFYEYIEAEIHAEACFIKFERMPHAIL